MLFSVAVVKLKLDVLLMRVMDLGFHHATRSGISFGKDDLIVPKEKSRYVGETNKKVEDYEQQYLDGLITQGENYNKVVDAWAQCADQVSDVMMRGIAQEIPGKPLNSLHVMASSGARGSETQMKQLAGMRGID